MQEDTPAEEADPLWAYKEIGKRLKVDHRTVRRWDRQGLLPRPSFQVEKYRRWRQSIIEMWITIGGTRAFRGRANRAKSEHESPSATERPRKKEQK